MINHEQLKQNTEEFQRTTGLSIDEFERLLSTFAALYQAKYATETTVKGQPRQRRAGGGAKGTLSRIEDKLLFILVYQQRDRLQARHGQVFGLSQSQTNEWLQRLCPLLEESLAERGISVAGPRKFARSR